MEEMRNANTMLVGKLGTHGRMWENNIKNGLKRNRIWRGGLDSSGSG